ncbi:MAG: hypothetical protein PHU85_16810 [Phycisphaerae bacterium]|nr:hypothetical protein [Phycisphaerae bacterium]
MAADDGDVVIVNQQLPGSIVVGRLHTTGTATPAEILAAARQAKIR